MTKLPAPKSWLKPGFKFGVGDEDGFFELEEAPGYAALATDTRRREWAGYRRAAIVQHRFFVEVRSRMPGQGFKTLQDLAAELDWHRQDLYNLSGGARPASLRRLGQIEVVLGAILLPNTTRDMERERAHRRAPYSIEELRTMQDRGQWRR